MGKKQTQTPAIRMTLNDIEDMALVMDGEFDEMGIDFFLDVMTGEIIRDFVGGRSLDYDSDEELLDALVNEGHDVDMNDIQVHDMIEKDGAKRYLRIPRVEPWAGYQDMKDFVDAVTDLPLKARLESAINGKGAFRRFKDVLARHQA
nr:UPF0158 family protein [Candidatus Sigynarchaeota archaeon]